MLWAEILAEYQTKVSVFDNLATRLETESLNLTSIYVIYVDLMS